MNAEQAEMIINNRCLDRDYPNFSDILGSDWITTYGMKQRTPQEYKQLAVEHAYSTLPTMWKDGKALY